MPSAKILPKSAPSKDKIKRKRAEDAHVAPSDKTSAEKPRKKSRKDDSHTTTSAPAVVQDKSTKPEKTGKVKVKTVAFIQDVSKDGESMRKAEEPHPEPTVSEGHGGHAEGPEPSDAEEEEEIHLAGFSSESDSSDEDLDVAEAPPLDVSQLPTFSKDDAVVRRKLEKAKKHPTEDKGVIYLGRIPHGFYEDQMRTYFSQFGDVSRLRLSRNKKTGRSKHYAFIEFDSSSVAQIVSETMDNYLLLGHILKCKVIPKDEVHPELWVGANKKWRFVPRDRLARLKQNKPRTQEEQKRAEGKLVARQNKKQAKILASGIDYDLSDVAYKRNIQA